MCCILSLLIFIGPRVAALAWYFIDTARWNAAFSNILWPCLGFLFVPWTTMAWVWMFTVRFSEAGVREIAARTAVGMSGQAAFGRRGRRPAEASRRAEERTH